MAKKFATIPKAPAPHTVASVARAVGCSENTIRTYLRAGLIQGVQRTPGGQAIFYARHIEAARELFLSRTARRAG